MTLYATCATPFLCLNQSCGVFVHARFEGVEYRVIHYLLDDDIAVVPNCPCRIFQFVFCQFAGALFC